MELPFFNTQRLKDKTPQKQEGTKAEKELGLETPMQRALEASLFIDKKFFDVSIITGDETPPELLFGNKQWEGYVNARNLAKQNKGKELSIDFITQLHTQVTTPVEPQISGRIREYPCTGGNYNNPKEPVTYTDEEIQSIKANPYLMFQEVGNPNTGFIHYPYAAEGTNPQDHVKTLLQEVCDWYNIQMRNEDKDPYKLAAQLQRKIISIHPFYDANGTTSRVLMNWALESNGVAPSALDNPSNDILTSEDGWINAVKKGSKKYSDSKSRMEALEAAGIEDIAYALGLSPEKTFYDYIFKNIGKAPAFFSSNGMQDHEAFEKFFNQFIEELKRFQAFLQSETKIGDKTITQGGLISDGFIKFMAKSGFAPKETADIFLTDVTLFRGGSLDIDSIDDTVICQMMTNYTGIGTGYRALQRSYMPAISADIASRQQITESAMYYNKMMAKNYLSKNHPDANPYGTEIKGLEQTIRDHVAANPNMWDSPFASTSFSRSVSLGFTGGLAKYGALFTVRAPKEGVVLSFTPQGNADGVSSANQIGFSFEKEGLVVGGLNPNSIEELRIYQGRARENRASFIAQREGDQVVISDLSAEFVVKRRYTVNPQTGQYIFAGTETTDVLSAQLDATKPQEEAVATAAPALNNLFGSGLPKQKFEMLDDAFKYKKKNYSEDILFSFEKTKNKYFTEFYNENKNEIQLSKIYDSEKYDFLTNEKKINNYLPKDYIMKPYPNKELSNKDFSLETFIKKYNKNTDW